MADSHLVDVSKMKVADLKRELKLRGLSTTGNKTELMDRLQSSFDNSKDVLSSEELIDEEDDLDEDVENDSPEKASSAETTLIDATDEPTVIESLLLNSSSTKTLKRKESEVIDDTNSYVKSPPKKIVLNRALSVPAEKTQKAITTTKIEISDIQPQEKKIIKLSNLTTKERLEMRAKKFGVSLTHDQKKEARMERFGARLTSTDGTIVNNVNSKMETLKKRAERFGGSVSTLMSQIESRERLEKRKARFGTISPIKETAVK